MAQKRANFTKKEDLPGGQAGKARAAKTYREWIEADSSSTPNTQNPFGQENLKKVRDSIDKQLEDVATWKRIFKLSDEENASFFQADEAMNRLTEKYGVLVLPVQTDEEFFSDALLKKSVSQGEHEQYFISLENPVLTSQVTEYLIRYNRIRHEVDRIRDYDRKIGLLEIAHEKRTEKSLQTAHDISPKIAELTKHFSESNNGKEPSLHKLAELLNEAKIAAPGGPQSKWYAQTVKRVMSVEKGGHQK